MEIGEEEREVGTREEEDGGVFPGKEPFYPPGGFESGRGGEVVGVGFFFEVLR